MNKTVTLILAILTVANVIYSFFGNSEYSSIFGFEVNIWVYRIIWSLLAVGFFYSYFNKNKINK